MKATLAIAAALTVLAGPAFAQEGDPEAGEKVFNRCQACHAVGEGAENKVGPHLNGVVGAEWAHVEDYNYSQDLLDGKAAGKVWDEETLNAYLENPKELAPKGKMAFAGLRDEQDRLDVIAYLKQFSE